MAKSYVKIDAEQGRRIAKVVRDAERTVPVLGDPGTPADGRRIPQALFAVKVTVDGGTAGSDSTTCSFTYTVKAFTGRTLGTALTPMSYRWPNMAYKQPAADSLGFAFRDETGALRLALAIEEVLDLEEPCPE